MQHRGTLYTIVFAGAICVVCSLLVSSSATILKERQLANARLERQVKVLSVSGVIEEKARPSAEEANAIFGESVRIRLVSLETGELAPEGELDPATYDQQAALKDPDMSRAVERNKAQVRRVPKYGVVYQVLGEGGDVDLLVLPVEGKGLWSTLYGFLALDKDCTTIRGLVFYQHGETPGLGGEVDNRNWRKRWVGRKAFDENWVPKIKVIKGQALPAEQDPYRVDGLSGATLTSNGVTNLVRFWLGDEGFGPYLAKFRAEGSKA